MLIMSLHQGISSWSTSSRQAWKDGSYCSGLLYAIIARVTSIAGLIFQVCYLPLHLISAVQNARQAFAAHKVRSTAYGLLIAAKTALLALSIIIHGSIQSAISILVPELVYTTFKAQKPLYAQQLISHVDSHEGIEQNLMTSIRQHLNATGLQFEDTPFQAHFRSVWLRNSLANNAAKEFGDPDPQHSIQQSLEDTISEYAVQQLHVLEQVDNEQYQLVLQLLPQNSSRQPTQQAQAVANQVRSHYSQENILLGKILFSHMQIACRDLCKRKCFSAEDLEMQMGGAYHAVVGLAILNMVSVGKVNAQNRGSIELMGGSQRLKLGPGVNIHNLRQSFLELRQLLTELENGRKGPNKQFYASCHKLLIARLSFPEKREDNEKIEKQRKELEQTHPQLAELEAKIFKQIGALIGVMNQRIISSNASGIDWSEAFKA